MSYCFEDYQPSSVQAHQYDIDAYRCMEFDETQYLPCLGNFDGHGINKYYSESTTMHFNEFNYVPTVENEHLVYGIEHELRLLNLEGRNEEFVEEHSILVGRHMKDMPIYQ